MKSILFVCLGNICRSPMAEFLCRERAKERHIALNVASAGTSGWHDGEDMHCGTAEILHSVGIEGRGFESRRIRQRDSQHFDYLIAMDNNNLAELEKLFGHHPKKIFKITDLIPQLGYDEVPDPWFTRNFNETRDILSQAIEVLLDKIVAGEM